MLNKKRPNWARLQDLCEDLKAKLSVKDMKKEDGTNTNLLMEKWKNASELRPFYIGGLDLSFFASKTTDDVAICGYVVLAFEGRRGEFRMVYRTNRPCQLKIPYK